MRRFAIVVCAWLVAASWFVTQVAAVEPLMSGDRIAIIGDSITEQKLYSKFIEAYLLACSGINDLRVFQFGWSGETAAGFSARLENDLGAFQPTVATLCYGMNDGGYRPYDDAVGKNYETNMRSVLTKLAKTGVTNVVVGSPGAVDSDTFRPGQKLGDQPAHVAYNDNLAHLRDIDQRLAEEFKQRFANVHNAMYDAMPKAKAALGKGYPVCGGDGFHPGPNGQLLMAQAFLKGLGLDGQIAAITIDLNSASSVSDGHKLLGGSGGKVELESTRWPFVFDGDEKSPSGTRSIVPFTSFNDDLNRFTLKVKGLTAPKAKVTWGDVSQEFTSKQLAVGVNLAAEFTKTPFDEPFQKLIAALTTKQAFETYMIKSVITTFRSMPAEIKADAELQAAFDTLRQGLIKRQQKLDQEARRTLVPVKHTITVTPL